MRTICVITGARSDYGLLRPIMLEILRRDDLRLQLVTTTMHQSPVHGMTAEAIENDGFEITERVENLIVGDTKLAMVTSTGICLTMLGPVLNRLRPDAVLLLGDRFETLAAASAAVLLNIPIAHVHGGEVTFGAVDDKIRHAITKMASMHFVTTEEYRTRVIQMGEMPENVYNFGAPGIDNIREMELLDRETFEKTINFHLEPIAALITYHPETMGNNDPGDDITAILDSVERAGIRSIITYANADNGGHIINSNICSWAMKHKETAVVIPNLGQLLYLSAMRHVDLMIGNTSSGIIESASFGLPVVNIGKRQEGRIRSGNVIDTDIPHLDIAIGKALNPSFREHCANVVNVYGEGKCAPQIAEKLASGNLSAEKRFHDETRDRKRL